MRFVVDANLPEKVAVWLRQEKHDAFHLRERNAMRLHDAEIVRLATVEHRVILTSDLDFADILSRSGETAPSVMIFRLPDEEAGRLIRRLTEILPALEMALSIGVLVMVEQSRYRVRVLPIGRPG